MASTHRFKATFRDIAATMKLSNHAMKRDKLVTELLVLGTDEVSSFYYRETSAYGPHRGLRRLPKVIFEILRCTVFPSIGGDEDAVGWPFFAIVNTMLSGDPINLLDWMVSQMLVCKWDVNTPLILQLYIMALVLCIVKNFKGNCKLGHQVYWPFLDNEAYLAWEPSPMSCRIPKPNSLGMF